MTTPDTDFAQLQDYEQAHSPAFSRRSTDNCDHVECPAIYILERRVDRHREEINELKALISKNSSDTAEVLEIVSMAKTFFKVLGWIGEKMKTIMAIAGFIGAILLWLKSSGTK